MEKIFETHMHLDDEAFNEDREKVIENIFDDCIGIGVNIGASMESTETSVELAQKYENVYAAVGVHPNEVADLTEDDMDRLKELSRLDKVVAIGEIGLEYHYLEPDKETQRKWFIRQLDLAAELNMPVVIHSRDAAEETFNLMKEYKDRLVGGVIHCYSYSPELAAEYVKMGYYIGVGGVVTFKNAKKLVETVKNIPLDNIVLETDCPYMSPEPFRGKRNDPSRLIYVSKKIAEIKGIDDEEVRRVTFENACRLYRIKR